MAEYAYVIRIGRRWFRSFGVRKRVQTAWTLAGARFYQDIDVASAIAEVNVQVARASKSKRVPMPLVEAVVVAARAFFDRVPGPLAAGPGGSGETRGASDASTGVEADSQPRGFDVCPEHGTHRVGDCDTDT